MNVSVSEQDARALLNEVPDTAAGQALKAKLAEGLDNSRTLTVDELEAVIVAVRNYVPGMTAIGQRLETALPKLQAIHQRTIAREQGRG